MAGKRAVLYRSDDDVMELYKTVVTPENFDSVMYYSPSVNEEDSEGPTVKSGQKKMYDSFNRCIFIGCDMSKFATLKGAYFNHCVFIDNDFTNAKRFVSKKQKDSPDAPPIVTEVSNLYNTMFQSCRFENNNFQGMTLLIGADMCKFNGDNFENTTWMTRYFYPDDKTWDMADVESTSFKCCNFKNAKMGFSINGTHFFNCDGPAQYKRFKDYKGQERISIIGLDMQYHGARSGSSYEDMRYNIVNDLVSSINIDDANFRGLRDAFQNIQHKRYLDSGMKGTESLIPVTVDDIRSYLQDKQRMLEYEIPALQSQYDELGKKLPPQHERSNKDADFVHYKILNRDILNKKREVKATQQLMEDLDRVEQFERPQPVQSKYNFDKMRASVVSDLTTPMQIYDYSLQASRDVMYTTERVSPQIGRIDRNIARMDKYMDLLELSDTNESNEPWRGMDALRHWLVNTDVRLEKTPSEVAFGDQSLIEYIRKPINRDKFTITYNQHGRLQSVQRNNDAELDLSLDTLSQRQRGARSL